MGLNSFRRDTGHRDFDSYGPDDSSSELSDTSGRWDAYAAPWQGETSPSQQTGAAAPSATSGLSSLNSQSALKLDTAAPAATEASVFQQTITVAANATFGLSRPNFDPARATDPGQGPVGSTAGDLSAAITAPETAGSGAASSNLVSAGGITFNLLWDAAAEAAPAAFRAGIEDAATLLSQAISDKITVDISIDYSGTGGGAAAAPDNGKFVSYATVRSDLINDVTPGDPTFNALPNASTIQGQNQVVVWNSELKLFGLIGPNDTTTDDGRATFTTDISSNSLVGVALHELAHALGRVPWGQPQDKNSSPDIFDLFRFTSPGTRLIADAIPSSAAYFSVDGGVTKLADYGLKSDPSDFLNSGVQGPNDVFNEFYSSSTFQSLTSVDLEQLDALGFHVVTSANLTIALKNDTGASSTDKLTDDPTLTGSAAPNATVTLTESGAVVGSVAANAAGVWTFKPALADGQHTIKASEVSGGGASDGGADFLPRDQGADDQRYGVGFRPDEPNQRYDHRVHLGGERRIERDCRRRDFRRKCRPRRGDGLGRLLDVHGAKTASRRSHFHRQGDGSGGKYRFLCASAGYGYRIPGQ